MLLAVAGLKDDEVKQQVQKLMTPDWPDFTPAERQAFTFAHKLTREPAAISDPEIRALKATFGPERTIDLIWYGAWCNYMTRVADAFQLPLERTNVFAEAAAEAKKDEAKKAKK